MLRKITAIAFLSVRSAVRSRFVICLAGILVMVITVLPMTIKGDGTLAGNIQVLLRYTLGLAAVITGIAAMWTACGSVSQEIEAKQITMVAVKPIHIWQIWIGKWLGLIAVNAALLLLSGTTVYLLLQKRVAEADLSTEQTGALRDTLLVGRRRVAPEPESVHDEAHRMLEKLIAEGKVDPDKPLEPVFKSIHERLLAKKNTVNPGHSRTWTFHVPREFETTLESASKASLRFSFKTGSFRRKSIAGKWIARDKTGRETFRSSFSNYLGGTHTMTIPASVLIPGNKVLLTFENAGPEESSTCVFSGNDQVEILAKHCSFESNLLKALLVIFCRLALLSAIGLAAGSLFSFPVAVFAASALVLVSTMVHYSTESGGTVHTCSHHHHGAPVNEETFVYKLGEKAGDRLAAAAGPALKTRSLGNLSEGILISWPLAGRVLAVTGLLYPAFFGIAGVVGLMKRELASP